MRHTGEMKRTLTGLFVFFAGVCSLIAEPPAQRYALVLTDEPVATKFAATKFAGRSRAALMSESASYRQGLEAKQEALKTELASRGIMVTGSVRHVLNAVFVQVSTDRVAELKALPGVKAVMPLRRFHLSQDALDLENVRGAWTAVGGASNAGAGVKIAIIDTGVDQTHAAFQDSSLTIPAGFPKCNVPSDCTLYTNNKVIVARSYTRQLGLGSGVIDPKTSMPDDYSARDRVGHGTAVAGTAAGVPNGNGSVTITGIAPKAFIGSYKVFGSPGVNDGSSGDVIIKAVDDAFADGMDVANISLGAPAFSGALDVGTICGANAGQQCDAEAQAVETAVNGGMVIVVAAGNAGADGLNPPTFNTISSPADAPSAIAAAATTNVQAFNSAVTLSGSAVPSNLTQLTAFIGDGPSPAAPITGPLVDVTTAAVGDVDGLLCSAVAANALNGDFALVMRGACTFETKVINAQNAGALAVIIYNNDNPIQPPVGVGNTLIPSVTIAKVDGIALKAFIDANPKYAVTIDPSAATQASVFNTLALFSSRGPSTGDSGLKPDMAAVGTSLFLAVQSFDPLGELYSTTGYAVADGTSFSSPAVAGAAALVIQNNPKYTTAAQVKSALVNTAAHDITDTFLNGPASVLAIGGGELNAANAVASNIEVAPASVSFGALNSATLPLKRALSITNSGTAPASLSLAIVPTKAPSASTILGLDQTALSIPAGQTATVNVTLSGTIPVAGVYEGNINITGGSMALHVPYLFLEGDGTPFDLIPLAGQGFSGTVGQNIPDGAVALKAIDQFGVPVANASVTFHAGTSGESLTGDGTAQTLAAGTVSATTTTDSYGIAFATVKLGPNPVNEDFNASLGSGASVLTLDFPGTARAVPTIFANGIVDAASFTPSRAVSPGSYVSIFGTGLSDVTDSTQTVNWPLNLDLANVSFDVPSAGISLPGYVDFVAPGQINLQVPWELAGQASAIVKVRIDFSFGDTYTLALAPVSPGFYEFNDGANTVAAALDANFNTISTNAPIARGSTVLLYANGLGAVTNQPADGAPALGDPHLSHTTAMPQVTIGGQNATVSFSGLAPGFPALYQINALVPAGISAGVQNITVEIGGVTSKTSKLAVK